jgi:hypothetical protein
MAEVIDPFRELAFSLLVQYGSGLRESADKRAILLDQLSQITSDFILQEATEQRDHLVAEQAFFSEAIIDLRLAELATLYVEKQRVALSEACKLLGSSEPVLDGELLMAVIYRLERRVLTDTSLEKGAIRDQIRRTLELLVPPADS